jgi:hypothetical protein
MPVALHAHLCSGLIKDGLRRLLFGLARFKNLPLLYQIEQPDRILFRCDQAM